MTILVLNGPNLNRLGRRQTEIYGKATLADLGVGLRSSFPDVAFEFFQSNHEGELIDRIHAAEDGGAGGIVFNPGALAHTSVSLRDAIASVDVPVVEVHVSNVYRREAFRHRSMLAPICVGQISGLGLLGYELAVRYLTRAS